MNRTRQPRRAGLAAGFFLALCLPILLLGAIGSSPATSYAASSSHHGLFGSDEPSYPSFDSSGYEDYFSDTQGQAAAFSYGQSYDIVYKMNGGTWPTTEDRSRIAREIIWHDETIKVKTLAEPVRFGYVFKGWYANKSLTKKASTIKGSSDAAARTLYAKWEKRKDPYNFVKTSGKVSKAEVNKVVKVLKKNKKLAKKFYLEGGTITLYSSAKYEKLFGTSSSGNTASSSYGPPRISLKARSGTSGIVVLHELGHWYYFYQVSDAKQTKIEEAFPKYAKKIRKVLGSYAASNYGEAYAETFSAIKNKSLSSAQKKRLGKWYTMVKSTL